jgi:hypothetical protein
VAVSDGNGNTTTAMEKDGKMRVEYDATLDDVADAHLRAYSRSSMARRWRRQTIIWTGLLTGLFMFVIVWENLLQRLLWAGFGVILGAGFQALTYREMIRCRNRNYIRERLGSDGPFRFMVELREDCVWTKQDATQVSFDWPNVREVVDGPDGIEFRMRDGGFVIVRNKGFASASERSDFLNRARALCTRPDR